MSSNLLITDFDRQISLEMFRRNVSAGISEMDN